MVSWVLNGVLKAGAGALVRMAVAGGLLAVHGVALADLRPSDTLLPCPYGYVADICASDINPGFEFIPVDGAPLFTGETLEPDATVHTFRVEVEIGAQGPSVADALATIEAVLGHPAGWTATGKHAFQHLGSETPALSILIATPETVDRLCAPLDTEGYFSCRNGKRAVLNVERWKAGVPHWTVSLEEYRAYLINHEVGHYLGMGHVTCPAAGEPAPVMQQQSIDLMACEPNGWPHR
jgi:hypothetical protein